MRTLIPRRRLAGLLAVSFALHGCGPAGEDLSLEHESEPEELYSSVQQGLTDCATRTDTGYTSGNAFTITVVTVDGKPVELDTANAFTVMQDAARAQGVNIYVVSGFRTMAEQQYLYACYVNCNCNSCNLAASPGYSNHQSGHALDLNTSNGAVYNWLTAHAGAYGFRRTVPSEAWHWEWWGGGPGGGACTVSTPDNCTLQEKNNCGAFGCGCVDHQCNGGACPGPGCSAAHTSACGGYGCGCADGECSGAFCPGSGCSARETYDCAQFGCGCADHKCSGGFCPGSGSTARNVLDCGAFGCHSVDGKCSGGYCPGTGCTAKQTNDCASVGCGCVDEKCSGGFCPGSGCTARQALDCQGADAGCAVGKCVPRPGPATPPAGQDGGFAPGDAGQGGGVAPVVPDGAGGGAGPEALPPPGPDLSPEGTVPPLAPVLQAEPGADAAGEVVGSCSSAAGSLPWQWAPLLLLALRRRARQRAR